MKRFNWMNESNNQPNSWATALLIASCLVFVPSRASAEMPSWWPGSSGEETAAKAPATSPNTTPAAATNALPAGQPPVASNDPMVDSPLFDISWPKVEMPKINWKPSWGNKEPASGVAKKDNPVSGALDKVANASKGAADGVRNAWGSAIGMLTPGGNSAAGNQVAAREEPGFWSRMFGPQPEPQGSQTVTEFLAQDRPGTTRR